VVVRVVVAEDALIVREGLLRVFELADGIDVVGIAMDLPGLLAAVDDRHPDVVLTDIRMPPTGTDEGIQAALRLRETHPDVGVVVLSQYVEARWALDLLAHDSRGRAYLLKERVAEIDQLTAAVREVARGGSVVDPRVVEALFAARSAAADSPLRFLTPRETEVLAQIAQGRSNAAIAAALVLSLRAVEKHINSLFGKLHLGEEPDVHRRVKAVLLYLRSA
jgi:DNA-binding NarL/FixJ family response regulator